MTMVDALASLQQLRATFAGLSGSGAPTNTSDATSSTDFDSLIAALSASTSSSSATTDASASTGGASSVGASSGTAAVGSYVANGPVTGADVVADASKYIGVPYVFGGESTSGMDCSGLVQKTFKDLGISVTRGVSTQKLQGQAVDGLANAKPGDLIVFKGGGHIAIYAGNDEVIHAPYPGRTVSLQKLWVGDSGIETIRRLVPSTAPATTPTAAAGSATDGSSAAPTVAQAQAAVTAAKEAVMQADLAMMSGASSSDSSSSALTNALGGSASSTDLTAPAATGAASTDSTDVIQQFLATQEALMSEGTS